MKKNFVSEAARDDAEAEYKLSVEQLRVAQENRRLAELEMKRAEEVLAQREIRSPVAGVIVEVMLKPGELTSSNQKDPIVKLMQVDPLNVELILPVQHFGRIKVGQRAWDDPGGASGRQVRGARRGGRPGGRRGERHLRRAPHAAEPRPEDPGRAEVPRALLAPSTSLPRALLAALALLTSLSVAAADAAVAVEVPAGKAKNIRLRNLPAGATMAVRITTTGKVLVALLKADKQPLFRGAVERRLTFRVSIPERGDYFLALSNRGGAEALEVQAEIRAVPAAKPTPPRDYSPRPDKAGLPFIQAAR